MSDLRAEIPTPEIRGAGTVRPPGKEAERLVDVQRELGELRQQIAALESRRVALEQEATGLLTHAGLVKKLAKLTPAELALLRGD
jgi:hypothetical protein